MAPDACATCLSRGRRRAPLGSLARVCADLLGERRLPPEAEVCWECGHFLKRCVKFAARAARAQDALNGCIDDSSDVPSLSSLNVTRKDYFDLALFEQLYPEAENDYEENISMETEKVKNNDIILNYVETGELNLNIAKINESDIGTSNSAVYCAETGVDSVQDCDELVVPKEIKADISNMEEAKLKPKQWLHIKMGNKIKKVPVFDLKAVQIVGDIRKASLNKVESPEQAKVNVVTSERPVKKVKVKVAKKLKKRFGEKKNSKKVSAATKSKKLKSEPRKTLIKKETSIAKTDNIYFKAVTVSEAEMQQMRQEDRQKAQYAGSAYKCEACVVGYYRESQLRDHERYKHTPKGEHERCPVCGVYVRSDASPAHRANHYTLFECRACALRLRAAGPMWSHVRRAHPPQPRVFACPHCDISFPTYKRRRYHVETRHRVEPAKCEYCGKSYRNRAILKTHIKNTHQDRTRVPCHVCGRLYLGEANMRAHARLAHRGDAAHAHRCERCDVTFKSKETYRTHLKSSRSHVAPDQMKYACPSCDKRFPLKRALADHCGAHHALKTNACAQCDKTYGSVRALRYHERRAHSDAPRARDKVCEVCGKGFYTGKALRVHVVVHSDERPYVCGACPASFRFYSALYKHERLKHQRPAGRDG